MSEKTIFFDRTLSRRQMLKLCGAISVSGIAANRAQAGGHNKVPVDDPQAVQLGYVEDATTASHDKYAAGKSCANCLLYADPELHQPRKMDQRREKPGAIARYVRTERQCFVRLPATGAQV